MARKLRIQYPGAIYHVMNRGDRQERIFVGDEDRQTFLSTLAEVCRKTGWQVHSFCLMPNHFHLVVETPSANLVEGMKWFLGVYTGRFNRRQRVCGHLFSGRYKALLIDGSGSGYLKTVCDYVHLNPARAGLLRAEQPLSEYQWSSYPLYVSQGVSRPAWLRVDRLLGEWRIAWDVPGAGARFAAVMEARRQGEMDEEFKPLKRGWCVGSREFRAEMLEYVQEQRGKWHYGVELCESAQAKAEHLIEETLKREGITEQELVSKPKGHPAKVQLAVQLRSATTVTVEWIARRLRMGSRGYVAQLLGKRAESPGDALGQTILDL